MTGAPSPMFPLGSVLLPSMLLPLHVFEDRYRTMTEHVLDGDGTFGVTLIERGWEVGGGDVRAPIGCRARVLEAEQQPDGRWHLLGVGTERIRVVEWLDDAPYPRAIVEPYPDAEHAAPLTDDEWRSLLGAYHDLLKLLEVTTGHAVPAALTADGPEAATYEMAVRTPLGPLDRYRVLSGPDARARREALLAAFEDATILVDDASSS